MINLVHSFYIVISVVPLNARVFQTLFSANNWLPITVLSQGV